MAIEFKQKDHLAVSCFLSEKGIPLSVCEKFEDEEIDGESFLDLTETDIKDLTQKLGITKKILRIVAELKEPCPLSPSNTLSRALMSPPPELPSPLSPTCSEGSSAPSSASSLLRSRPCPKGFKVPDSWRPSIMQVLDEESDKDKKRALTIEVRNEIVRDLVSLMYSYMEKPTKDFCTEVAKLFVAKFPFAKDAGDNVSGYGTWEKRLIDRVHNTRSKKRKQVSSDEAGTPHAKRGRPKIITILLRYPPVTDDDLADDVTYDRNMEMIKKELMREHKRKEGLLPLMKITFPKRRHDILVSSSEISFSTMIEKHPGLAIPFVLEQELDLILKKTNTVRSAVSAWRTKWAPAILRYCKSIRNKAIKEIEDDIDEEHVPGEEEEERLAFRKLCAILLKKGSDKFVYEECRMTDDIEDIAAADPPRPSPRIAFFGDPDSEQLQYFIIIEKKVLCSTSTVAMAIMLWFAVHYVFHLEYCKQAKELALFVQEFIFKYPDKSKKTVTYMSVCTSLQTFTEANEDFDD